MKTRLSLLAALIVALAIVVVELGLAPALAGSRRGPTLRGLAHRVAVLEARVACTKLVAPVSQFGAAGAGDPLQDSGYPWIDNSTERIQMWLTTALDLDPGAAPQMYVALVSPGCVRAGHFRSLAAAQRSVHATR